MSGKEDAKAERGSTVVGARLSRRGDERGLNVGGVPDGTDARQLRVGLELRERLQRRDALCVEVEDDQRGAARARLGDHGLGRPREHHVHAELARDGPDLRTKEQVVHSGDDHGTIMRMIVETRAVGPFFKNGFVLGCDTTREAIVIDPGDEVDDLVAFVAEHRLAVRFIMLTHAHVDHITGVGRAKREWQVPITLHRDDLLLYDRATQIGLMFGLRVAAPPPVDVFYEPGQVFRFGQYEVRPHHTPGHCPGGVCLQVGPVGAPGGGTDLFVGDTLFAGSIGRTDLPGGDFDTLIGSIKTTLYRSATARRSIPATGHLRPLAPNGARIRFSPGTDRAILGVCSESEASFQGRPCPSGLYSGIVPEEAAVFLTPEPWSSMGLPSCR